MWIWLINLTPSIHRHTWWVHKDWSPLWNAGHFGHCIFFDHTMIQTENENLKYRFFPESQTVLAALFEQLYCIVAKKNTDGSEKKVCFLNVLQSQFLNQLQRQTLQTRRLKKIHRWISDVKIYIFLNSQFDTRNSLNLTAAPATQHTVFNRNLH